MYSLVILWSGTDLLVMCVYFHVWQKAELLHAVQALVQDKGFKKWVVEYAKNQDRYFEDFAAAYEKLLHLGVPVNNPGQHAPA